MPDSNAEMRREQQRVDEVAAIVKRRMTEIQNKIGGTKGDIIEIRRNFWDDVTVNFEDSVETAETYASMKQQAELLSERERSYRVMDSQLALLRKLANSPYFGRVDLIETAEDGPIETEQIYLGIGSLLDDSEENYLIYDWRAPVSSLYYDYGPGAVQYKTPNGIIHGEMTLKRQYIIRNAQIRAMFDTGVTIGDELLQEVLGSQSDAQMKTIVATIQQEQNRIIRNEQARLLIVQGSAGSGKTSAALQRVAYLLYRYRGVLSANQILLFSPNPMFNSYISTVLPELGEDNMQQTTYQQYMEHRLGGEFALEDAFSQMEYMLTAAQDAEFMTRSSSIAYKSSFSFMKHIDEYAARLGESGLIFKPIQFRGRTLVASELIAEQFYMLDRTSSIANRLRKVSEWLLKELTRLGKREKNKKWVEAELELLSQEDFANAFEQLARKNKFTEQSFNDYEAERDLLASAIVQRKFKKLRKRAKRLEFLDVPAIYRKLFESGELKPGAGEGEGEASDWWEAVCRTTLADLDQSVLRYEDATAYLYLMERLVGFHTNTSIMHLFIDEAQDYSPFQYHYLKRIFPNCRMTILGDINQSIFAHSHEGDGFSQMAALYNAEEVDRVTLCRSYRSTRQIVNFTSKIIENGHLIEPFNRDGSDPEITQVSDEARQHATIYEKLTKFQSSGYSTIAVICKTAEESLRIYRALLPRLPQLRIIEKETVTFEKGMVVIPSYLAKGVEFDAVVISDASERSYSDESVRRLFYTACTRAMHELQLISMGEITPFLR